MTSKTIYVGENRIDSLHESSGDVFTSYIPTNDFSVREHFSPTDIFATALAQSAFANLVVLGKERNIDITGATCDLKKTMYFEPRRIGEIFCVFKFPHSYTQDQKDFLENAVRNSPVYLSLNEDIKKIFLFEYND